MSPNMGLADQALRIGFGLVLILIAMFGELAAFDNLWLQYGAVAVGIVLMATAAVRICPLYTLLGLRTCRR